MCKVKDFVLFEVLYERSKQLVFIKYYGFIDCKDEAEDLIKDGFLYVFVKLSTFKAISCFSMWLYAITFNFVTNYFRSNRER